MLKLIIGSVMVVLLVTAAFAQTVFGRVGPQEANDTGSSIGSPADAINQTPPVIDHMTGMPMTIVASPWLLTSTLRECPGYPGIYGTDAGCSELAKPEK